MRTPDRDRRRSAVTYICASVIVAFLVAGGALSDAYPTARYAIFPNGTAYEAEIFIGNATGYEFYEAGVLGERNPLKVTNVRVTGECDPCTFNRTGPLDSILTVPPGNHTIHFQGPIRDFHLQGTFDQLYLVEVALPDNYNLENPLLGMISPGGTIIREGNTSRSVQWNGTRSFELRFYDTGREELLYLFGNFWIVIAVVLLMPFVFSWRKRRQGP